MSFKLPNEILLEIWDRLPPLERIIISQVFQKWRNVVLCVPRLWGRIALVSTVHETRCRAARRNSRSRSAMNNIYNPRSNTTNLAFAAELFLRSKDLPLDVTLSGTGCLNRDCPNTDKKLYNALAPHRHRIARLHFPTAPHYAFDRLLGFRGSFPALRTLTAGFDEQEVEYADLPPIPNPPVGASLPVLRQVHLGADAQSGFIDWLNLSLPSVEELTITPSRADTIPEIIRSCSNLSHITIVLSQLEVLKIHPTHLDALASIPPLEITLSDISVSQEKFILQYITSDARFHHITLDYVGRARRPGSSWYHSLASPFDILTGPMRLTLTLRESVYELAAVDAAGTGIRREVLLDYATIHMAPGLWEYYLRSKRLESATIDAAAWSYFVDRMPDDLRIQELTLVVLHGGDELQKVSLAHFGFGSLKKLRIDSVVKLGTVKIDTASLRRLFLSIPRKDDCDVDARLLLPLYLSPRIALGEGDRNGLPEVCKIVNNDE